MVHVVVIGGGPAGAACARELAAAGYIVRLFSAGEGTGPPLGETVGPSLVRMLWSIGLSLPPECGSPLESFGVSWEDEKLTDVSTRLWDVTVTHALDRSAFDRWLRREAANAGVIVSEPARAIRALADGDGWRVLVREETGEEWVATRCIIEATGRVARSVCEPEIARFYTDLLFGLSINLDAPVVGASEAVVEACEDGWWYYLAVTGRPPFASYFVHADDLPCINEREAWLASRLCATKHVRKRISHIPPAADIRIWDARTSIRSGLWRGNWLVIGDAAWAMDPLSGEGVERAIHSGLAAARATMSALANGTPKPLGEFAIGQVNSFKAATETQRRVYSNVTRFNSRFWTRLAR